MPAWLIPALKAVLPHIGTIVSVAVPAFTKKRADSAETAGTLQQQQIAELQTAAAQNATHIRELAEQLQVTVRALEQAVAVAETRHRRLTLLCVTAITVSAVTLLITMFPAMAGDNIRSAEPRVKSANYQTNTVFSHVHPTASNPAPRPATSPLRHLHTDFRR